MSTRHVLSPILRRPARVALRLLVLTTATLLAACASRFPTYDPLRARWVEIGPEGVAMARAVTTDAACPAMTVDGRPLAMTVRARPDSVAQRPTVSAAEDSKPSDFPVTACEAVLPAGTRAATIARRPLPVPSANPRRIIVMGDTGCRIKKADNLFQACTDRDAWPFPGIAATAAGMKPDLVIHVGDYHYRENICPDDVAGCRGSPWGYGWDAWEADFFQPAAPLLAEAPWVVLRGNHEECDRAGQGWARYLDPHPFEPAHSCDRADDDATGNFSEPYAVPLGSDLQLIVFDSAAAGNKAFKAGDPRASIYAAQFREVQVLANRDGVASIFADHHPILAFAPASGTAPYPGNAGLQAAMATVIPGRYFPRGVRLALHGHVHDFQALDFSSGQPATMVVGNGGDNVDVNLPDPLPPGATPAPGAVLQRITHTNSFGFLVMDHDINGSWRYTAVDRNGTIMTICTPAGSRLLCDRWGQITN